MQRGVFMQTCLTTNFDKLIELAFAQQGDVECQPIRMQEEARFWGTEPDKCYAIKLHGDYDTHNILNTRNETLQIEPDLLALTARALADRGLVVLGAAGHEESVLRFLNDLTLIAQKDNVLSMGLFWGIHIGSAKREELTEEEWRSAVLRQIESGAVSEENRRIDGSGRYCVLSTLACSFQFKARGRSCSGSSRQPKTARSRVQRSCTSIMRCGFDTSLRRRVCHRQRSTSTSAHSRSSDRTSSPNRLNGRRQLRPSGLPKTP